VKFLYFLPLICLLNILCGRSDLLFYGGKRPFSIEAVIELSYDLFGGLYKVLLARERVLPLSLLRFVFNCV